MSNTSEQFWASQKTTSPHASTSTASTVVSQSIPIKSNEWIVAIEDCMGRLYGSSAKFIEGVLEDEPYREQLRTDAVYERFVRPIIRNIESTRNLLVQVVCFDKPWFVAFEKTFLQKQRVDGIVKYPLHAKLTDAGIDVGESEFAPEVEPLNLTRLLCTRELRQKLYLYFLERMKRDPRLRAGRIILDFCERGPWIIINGRAKQDSSLANEMGEGDLAAFWWALKYNQHHIIINSIDHDLMLIAFQLHHLFPASLLVQCKPDECINIKLLAKAFAQARKSLVGFMIGVIMCGTDFVAKSTLANQFGDELVVEVVMRFWNDTRSLANKKDFRRLMRSLYDNAVNSRCKMPDEANLAKGYNALAFNVHYWKTIDATLTILGLEFLPSLKRKRQQDEQVGETKTEKMSMSNETESKHGDCMSESENENEAKRKRQRLIEKTLGKETCARSDSIPMLETATPRSGVVLPLPSISLPPPQTAHTSRFQTLDTVLLPRPTPSHNAKPSSFTVHKTVQTTLTWSTATQMDDGDDATTATAQNQARLVYSKKTTQRGSKRKYGDDKMIADVQIQTFDLDKYPPSSSRPPSFKSAKRMKLDSSLI